MIAERRDEEEDTEPLHSEQVEEGKDDSERPETADIHDWVRSSPGCIVDKICH